MNRQQRASLIIGIILAVAMVASLILPLLLNTSTTTQTHSPAPTDIPLPTAPAPIADLESISFDETFLHPSGTFTVGVPTGWQPLNTQSLQSNEALAVFSNPDQLSVVEVRLVDPDLDITQTSDLNLIFDNNWLSSSWREYQSWQESLRNVEGDRLIIDFELARSRQNYIARQEAWYDGEWVYVVRAVTPSNASEQLQYVLNNVTDTVQANPQFFDSPLAWNSYFDSADRHIIRFPNTWQITDTETGALTTVTDGTALVRIETGDTTIDSEDGASEWVEGWRSGIDVLSVETIERDGAGGYSVAYILTSPDGDIESGLAVLLNGTDEQLHVANLRFSSLDAVDLNLDDTPEDYTDYKSVLDSFYFVPNLDIASSES